MRKMCMADVAARAWTPDRARPSARSGATSVADALARGLLSSVAMTTRVMIAEDDADLRAAMTAMLRDEGLDVVDVPDGIDACLYLDDCILRDRPRPRIHALVTDLAMPEMSGARLLDHLDELGHALPTVVVTGLDSDVVERVARRPFVRAVLRKPLDADALLRALEIALEPRESLESESLEPLEAQGRWK